ncbi:LysR family transcriptional regulator [Candidimonas nitroreducens]|uniref:Transcriptional regulator n=1 Tax=Candidimonas nitroreducens TaxID=683354 RepID=A0A225MN27_9BURK|nr:LysR family transcriptional regulator [Candidimonas nitroreducens]OWT60179.1 transcriptional regulator [Candidimonas nitroreducens]
MDTITNFRTFIEVAQAGGFSRAARKLGLATSVITKRVEQLEWQTRCKLFERSTRKLALTEHGHRLLPVAQRIVHDVDDALINARGHAQALQGLIRIKVPTSLTIVCMGDILSQFQEDHPNVDMDIVVIDRPVNPVQEGFDIAVGMMPASYDGVFECGLCPLPRVVVAAPDYIRLHGRPLHPTDLTKHRLLNFQPTGPVWTFSGKNGPIAVGINPHLSTNDGHVLLKAAIKSGGIALLSSYIVSAALRKGQLVELLDDFPIPQYWIRALVPESRLHLGRVQALLSYLRDAFSPTTPWDIAA